MNSEKQVSNRDIPLFNHTPELVLTHVYKRMEYAKDGEKHVSNHL